MGSKISRHNLTQGTNSIGTVSNVMVDPASGVYAKVYHGDQKHVVSHWFQVMQGNAGAACDYWIPQVGEQVKVSYLGTGHEVGVIDGSFFSKQNPPPSGSLTVSMRREADGTVIMYDSSTSTMTINARNKIKVSCMGDMTVAVGGTLNATVVGNATVKAPTITLDTPTTHLTGNLVVDGAITAGLGGGGGTIGTFNGSISVIGSGNATVRWNDSTGSGVSA